VDIIQDQSTTLPGFDDDDDYPEAPEAGYTNGDSSGQTDFRLILEAPDFATFIKRTKNARVREYEKRTASAFKAIALGAMQADDFPDAAAILWYGPAIATATGHVADTSERARHLLDIVTAPNSPWVALAASLVPLVAQLARNHEPALEELPKRFAMGRKAREARKQARVKEAEKTPPRFTIKIGRWQKPVRFQFSPWRLMSTGIKAQTVDPTVVTSRVFTNEDLLHELRRIGFNIKPVQREP
jgi:hypothetical protein